MLDALGMWTAGLSTDRFPMSYLEDQYLEFLLPNSEEYPEVADSEPVVRLTCEPADISKGFVVEFPHFIEDSPGDVAV